MSLSQRTITAGAWQLTAVVTRTGMQLLVLAVLARHVSPDEFGYIAIANMVLVFVEMLADAGIGPAIIQKKELSQRHINAGFFLSVVLGILFFSVIWLGAPLIAVFFESDNLAAIAQWMGLSALVTKMSNVSRAQLEREMRFDILMWVDTGSYLFGYALVGIILALMNYGVWAIVAGKLVQSSLQAACLFIIRPSFTRLFFTLRECKELLRYGGGLTFARIFDNIASQGDYFVIGRFLGSTQLGFYDRASSIMVMPGQYLNLVLDKALFPAMSQIQDQKKRLEKAYFTSTSIVSTSLIPLTILMYLLAPEIIATILGPNWSASVLPFRVLLLTAIFRIFITISDTLVRATGAVYASAARKAIYAFLIIAGSWMGHFWGLVGVAIAVDVAVVIGYSMMIQLSMNLIGYSLSDYLRLYRHGLALGFILYLILAPGVILMRVYEINHAVLLFSALALSALLILSVFFFFPKLLGESVQTIFNKNILLVPFKKIKALQP